MSKGEGLLTEVKRTQRELYNQGTHQQGWQLTTTKNMEHTAQLQAAQQVRVSFPTDSSQNLF